MKLIFGYQGFDLGQFPNLVPQRSQVVPRQFATAASAQIGLTGDDIVALLDRNQGPRVFRMARLPTRFFVRSRFRSRRFGVWMLRTRRHRRVLRRLPRTGQFRLQFRELLLIMLDDRPHQCLDFTRQGSELLRRNRWLRHRNGVANFRLGAKTNSLASLHQGVADYAAIKAYEEELLKCY